MKKMMTKATVVALLAVMSVSFSGCYGPFALTSKLHDWNGQVSNKKFVNELVFIGLCILPAYELCVLGDGLIFNSIEFWGGNNPIAMNEGDVEEADVFHDGRLFHVIKSKNNMSVALKDNGKQMSFRYFPEEKVWYRMNGDSKKSVVDIRFES